jgi:hypothetical protein
MIYKYIDTWGKVFNMPNDQVSIENAIIAQFSLRFPLFIDPFDLAQTFVLKLYSTFVRSDSVNFKTASLSEQTSMQLKKDFALRCLNIDMPQDVTSYGVSKRVVSIDANDEDLSIRLESILSCRTQNVIIIKNVPKIVPTSIDSFIAALRQSSESISSDFRLFLFTHSPDLTSVSSVFLYILLNSSFFDYFMIYMYATNRMLRIITSSR